MKNISTMTISAAVLTATVLGLGTACAAPGTSSGLRQEALAGPLTSESAAAAMAAPQSASGPYAVRYAFQAEEDTFAVPALTDTIHIQVIGSPNGNTSGNGTIELSYN